MKGPPLGLVVHAADDGNEYVYVGTRITSIGSAELIFCRVMQVYWPQTLRTYHASRYVTLVRKFPALREYLDPADDTLPPLDRPEPRQPERVKWNRVSDPGLPDGARYVGGSSKLYKIFQQCGRDVEQFRDVMIEMKRHQPLRFSELMLPMRTWDIACHCELGDPCHGDVVLELANDAD